MQGQTNNQSWRSKPTPISTVVTLFVMLIIVVWYQFFTPLSQGYNLRAIKAWIEQNDAGWQELVVTYPELKENVTLSAYTGGDGMLGVSIRKPISTEAEAAMFRWILKNKPPRAINLVLPNEHNQDDPANADSEKSSGSNE